MIERRAWWGYALAGAIGAALAAALTAWLFNGGMVQCSKSGSRLALAAPLSLMASEAPAAAAAPVATSHAQLVTLFADWRTFNHPQIVHGKPDYSAPAMAAKAARLPEFRRRLTAIDTTRMDRVAARRLSPGRGGDERP